MARASLGRDRLAHGRGRRPYDRARFHVVAVDYGAKRNILRCLANAGCRVSVVRADTSAEDILGHRPDGIFLSNGPGDPAATGVYAVPVIRALLENRDPGLRNLPRPPAPGAGARRQDREDAPRPRRRQPSGQGFGHWTGRDHDPEPRLRSCQRFIARRSRRDPPFALRRQPRGDRGDRPARLFGAVSHPRPRPAPATAIICSSASRR